MDSSYQASGLRDIVTVLFKHWRKMFFVFFLTLLLGIIATLLITPQYEATSTFMIKLGREHMNSSDNAGYQFSFQSFVEHTINAEIQVLQSRDLLERVVTTVGIDRLYPELEGKSLDSAVKAFRNDFSIDALERSNVISISFFHRNAQTTADTVNLFVSFFKEKHLEVLSNPRSAFLEEQTDFYRSRLENSKGELADFKRRSAVYSYDDQLSLMLKQRATLGNTLNKTSQNVEELSKRLSSIEEQIKTVDRDEPIYVETGADRFKIIDDAKAKLLSLRLKKEELSAKYKDDSRFIQDINNEIQLVDKFLSNQAQSSSGRVTHGRNSVYKELETNKIKTRSELEGMVGKAASIREQLEDINKNIQEVTDVENTLTNLEAKKALDEANYQVNVQKLEEARIEEGMDRHKLANISVIQKAVPAAKPVKPKYKLNLAISLLLAGTLGLLTAFISEYLSQGLVTPESVEARLGIPVLATVGKKNAVLPSNKLLPPVRRSLALELKHID